VREALFARLDPDGAAVLDLYAGTGALGIEALSRGAAGAVFVEAARTCLAVLRANLDALDLASRAEVVAGDAVATLARLAREGRRFDLVLLDPPYVSDEAERALGALAGSELLPDGAMVVVESSRRHPPGAVTGMLHLDERRYGDTLITRFRRAGASGEGRSTRG
jgi:16S rRNA (guanine(966)-N(2))-methyltransferase RsmD